jgi:hypothetical protein
VLVTPDAAMIGLILFGAVFFLIIALLDRAA